MTDSPAKVPCTPENREAFLAKLADTGSVRHACNAVGIARRTAYWWRNADPEFAAAWDRAKAESADALEDEAIRRAHDGVEEPLHDKGRLTGETVRKYSDTLLIFLLKGNNPKKFRENVSLEASGPGGGPIQIDDSAAADKLARILATAAERRDKSADDLV